MDTAVAAVRLLDVVLCSDLPPRVAGDAGQAARQEALHAAVRDAGATEGPAHL